MKVLRAVVKVLRIILLMVFAAGLVVGVTGLQLAADGFSLLRPEPYLAAFRESGLYESLPDLLDEVLRSQVPELSPAENDKILAALRQAAPPELVEAQVSPAVADIFALIMGRTTKLTAVIHIEEFTSRFLAAYGKTANRMALAQLRMMVAQAQLDHPLSLADYQNAIAAQVEQARHFTGLARTAAVVLAAVCLLLVVFTVLLAGGLAGGARWTGMACLLSGFVGLVASTAAASFGPSFIKGFNISEAPQAIQHAVSSLAAALTATVTATVRVGSLAVLGLGAALFVAAALLNRGGKRTRAGARTKTQTPGKSGSPRKAGTPGTTAAPGTTHPGEGADAPNKSGEVGA